MLNRLDVRIDSLTRPYPADSMRTLYINPVPKKEIRAINDAGNVGGRMVSDG